MEQLPLGGLFAPAFMALHPPPDPQKLPRTPQNLDFEQ
jgi:hypothetical protein